MKVDNRSTCSKCLKKKSDREYYSVGNDLKVFYYNVKLPICKSCIKLEYSRKTNIKTRKEFLINIAQMLDKYCTEEILEKALSAANVINSFMTTMNNPSNRNKTFLESAKEQMVEECKEEVKDYYTSKMDEGIKETEEEYKQKLLDKDLEVEELREEIKREKEVREEELKRKEEEKKEKEEKDKDKDPFNDESKGRTPKLKKAYNLSEEVIKKWFSKDISYEEISWCEDSHKEYVNEFNIDSITRKSDLKSLIQIKLLERQAIQTNDIDSIGKLQRAISSKETDLGIKRSQEKSESFESFGQKILHYENTTPLPREALPEEYRDINFTDFNFLKQFGWTNVTAEKVGRDKFVNKYFKDIDKKINE